MGRVAHGVVWRSGSAATGQGGRAARRGAPTLSIAAQRRAARQRSR